MEIIINSIAAERRRPQGPRCVDVNLWYEPLHGIPIAGLAESQTAQQKHDRHFHLGRLREIWGPWADMEAYIGILISDHQSDPIVDLSVRGYRQYGARASLSHNNYYLSAFHPPIVTNCLSFSYLPTYIHGKWDEICINIIQIYLKNISVRKQVSRVCNKVFFKSKL